MDVASVDIEKGRTEGDGEEQVVKATSLKVEQATAEIIKTANAVDSFQVPSITRQQTRRTESAAGHENVHNRKNSTNGMPLPGLHSLYRRPDILTRNIAPVVPKGELVPLKPRLIGQINILPEHKKTKPPKFVPYEPYPGAVNPLEPQSVNERTSNMLKKDKNNLEIGVLVSQLSTIRTQELREEKDCMENASPDEVKKLNKELKKLREERDYYHGQFKFQTQVNAELKNLLVASVGEDLQTRVNVLTEDKLQLARALLDTANNLTTHTEQIEFLAGQCEVWRSKFLSSSVMIEELARWKADLNHKNQILNEATKGLLQSMQQLRDMQLEILKNLKFVAKIRYLNLPATDVFTLSAENLNIVQQMVLHTNMHGIPEAQLNISSASKDPLSKPEKYAAEALEIVSQPLMATDEAIRALFGQAQRPYGLPGNNIEDDKNQTSVSVNRVQQI